MNVTKRNGKVESFNEDKILACIRRACGDDETLVQKVYWNTKLNLYKSHCTIINDTDKLRLLTFIYFLLSILLQTSNTLRLYKYLIC